jgi:creatinine amidohydrolase/Fe(II)-dependent formamide hydrolase-like protein
MARKGTLTLRKETLRAYIYDVTESLQAHGIGCVLVVNGHGGNGGLLKAVLPDWRHQFGITVDEVSYWEGITEDDRAEILQGYRDLRDGKLDTVARQTALNHASEDETSIMMAAYPQRVRSFTMEEHDKAELDYANNLSPEVENYLRPFGKDGWPKGGPNPENPRDQARQENALLATAEKGEALISIHVRYVGDKLQRMIEATEQGLAWPPTD